jgi:hypothetical protein
MPWDDGPASFSSPACYFPFEGLARAFVFLRFGQEFNNIILPSCGVSASTQRFNHGQVVEDFLNFHVIQRL